MAIQFNTKRSSLSAWVSIQQLCVWQSNAQAATTTHYETGTGYAEDLGNMRSGYLFLC
jgi:predicted nuclease with RNAse H fold